jgi:RimJ/RimL family protein N-acetyltransferase
MRDMADRLETERLVIRRFTTDDWADVQKLALDKESSEGGKYDHPWPTSEEGCRGAAGYFSTSGKFWAVCLKDSPRIIGLLALSSTDEPGTMELGHVFHTGFVSNDHDTEALGRMVDYAFADLGAQRLICNNVEEWAVQLAPLQKLGMRVEARGDGTDFFQRDADGEPIAFVGCGMALTQEEWLQSGQSREPEPGR